MALGTLSCSDLIWLTSVSSVRRDASRVFSHAYSSRLIHLILYSKLKSEQKGKLFYTNLRHGVVLQRTQLGEKIVHGAAELQSITLNDEG